MSSYKYVPLAKHQRKILVEYGYQWCPEALAAEKKADVDRAMVRAWQTNFENELTPLVATAHGRGLIADGDMGPATAFSLHMPRCGHADYKDPNAVTAEANWPTGCRSKLTWAHRIPSLKGLTQAQIADGLRAAFAVWSDVLLVGFEERQSDWPNVHFQERSKNLGGGGVLARHLLAHNRCDSNTWGEYNTVIDWSRGFWPAVPAHEIGHGLGLDHVVGSQNLMNPSITQAAIDRGGKPSEADLREADRKGYQRRTDKPDPPPTPTGNVTYSGRLLATDEQGNSRPALFQQKVTFL